MNALLARVLVFILVVSAPLAAAVYVAPSVSARSSRQPDVLPDPVRAQRRGDGQRAAGPRHLSVADRAGQVGAGNDVPGRHRRLLPGRRIRRRRVPLQHGAARASRLDRHLRGSVSLEHGQAHLPGVQGSGVEHPGAGDDLPEGRRARRAGRDAGPLERAGDEGAQRRDDHRHAGRHPDASQGARLHPLHEPRHRRGRARSAARLSVRPHPPRRDGARTQLRRAQTHADWSSFWRRAATGARTPTARTTSSRPLPGAEPAHSRLSADRPVGSRDREGRPDVQARAPWIVEAS